MLARMPWSAPKMCCGLPKAILYPNSTQQISTRANATKAIIIEFTDHRFCITPPYSTTSPGTLISPTSVAAVSCQAVSPGFKKCGYGNHVSTANGIYLAFRCSICESAPAAGHGRPSGARGKDPGEAGQRPWTAG